MKKFIIICVSMIYVIGAQAQNWDINTLHKINSLDGKFVRNYSKVFSRSAPYISVGIPVAMAIYAGIDKDKKLLQDAIYIGTSVQKRKSFCPYSIPPLRDRKRSKAYM